MNAQLSSGFADPVLDAQAVFRALLDAMARPGRPVPVLGAEAAPQPLTPTIGALALTLFDHETSVWLDPTLAGAAAVTAWLAFHCGAPLVDNGLAAAFAVVSTQDAAPRLDALSPGTDAFPDRSTTLILPGLAQGLAVRLRGPGIEGTLETSLPVSAALLEQWADNRALFPRGADLVIASDGHLIGLPRTTRIERL